MISIDTRVSKNALAITLPTFSGTGTYSTTSNYLYKNIIVFTSGTQTFTLTKTTGNVSILLVGGGGGGGGDVGGGGGAGGVVYQTGVTLPAGTYSTTIGTGGAGSPATASGINNSVDGTNGSPTFITFNGSDLAIGGVTYRALGGGGGGNYNVSNATVGHNGGSGGGGSGNNGAGSVSNGGSATQPNTDLNIAGGWGGANGTRVTGYAAGGGGGAGGAGNGKNGGPGVLINIGGSSGIYAAGGGGGVIGDGSVSGGAGGSGIGGYGNYTPNSGSGSVINATQHNGLPGTGSGGGGGSYNYSTNGVGNSGGTGASGSIIIAYSTGTMVGATSTITPAVATPIPTTTTDGYNIYAFTSSVSNAITGSGVFYVMAVGGGGAGGSDQSGGGGGGGVVQTVVELDATDSISVNIGAGGVCTSGTPAISNNGGNTTVTFATNTVYNITAYGGGGGGGYVASAAAGNGGSGGGGGYYGGSYYFYGTGTSGQGYSGAPGNNGGGGGAGQSGFISPVGNNGAGIIESGTAGSLTAGGGGAGGSGISVFPWMSGITFSNYKNYLWGGGGGAGGTGFGNATNGMGGNGGSGGGGGGSANSYSGGGGGGSALIAGSSGGQGIGFVGGAAGTNTGGGGGGSSGNSGILGGAGGSGMVLIAYKQQTVAIGFAGTASGYSSTVTTGSGYNIYVFTTDVSNAIVFTGTGIIYILAVGGGGGGGNTIKTSGGGGGGGGGVVQATQSVVGGDTMTISIGAGGAGVITGTGNSGGNTMVKFTTNPQNNITAYGGGGGGGATAPTSGGSGGGACSLYTSTSGVYINGGLGTIGQGNFGGSVSSTVDNTQAYGGGGGGAGEYGVGGYALSNVNKTASGGKGIQCSLPGIANSTYGNYYWAGGGGGGNFGFNNLTSTVSYGSVGNGGLGGGGGGSSGAYAGWSCGSGGGSALNTGSNGTYLPNTSSNAGANTGGGGGGGAGGGYNPSLKFDPSIIGGLTLWFDASDPYNNGTQASNGSSIYTWYDKSGKGSNAINSLPSVPAYYSSDYNGMYNYPAIYFPPTTVNFAFGTSPNTTSPSFRGSVATYTGTQLYFFVVSCGYLPTGSAMAPRILSMGVTGTRDYNSIASMTYMYYNNQFAFQRNGQITRTYCDAVNSTLNNKVFLSEGWFDGTSQASILFCGSATAIASRAETNVFNIQNFSIGYSLTDDITSPYCGFISEILVYNTALTLTQRQQIEGYLSWKWGLQENLPIGHPYYYSAPALSGAITGYYTNANYFSPATIGGCLLWLDASGASNYILSTSASTTITQWNDKSGNKNHMIASGSPLIVYNVINNRSAIYSSSSSNYFQNNNITLPTPPYSIFIVAYNTTSGQQSRFLSGISDAHLMIRTETNNTISIYNGSGGSWNVNITTSTAYTTPVLIEQINSGNSVGGMSLYINGTQSGASVNGTATGFIGLYLGNWTGYIAEVIIYNSVLSTAQRQLVEGYLAWKWGLQTNLPAAHPYYSSAAGSSGSVPSAITYTTPLNNISANAYSTCQGAYACCLLNSKYNGPVMQLRLPLDICGNFLTDFYADSNGNLNTKYNNAGYTITGWIDSLSDTLQPDPEQQAYAYVTKWYDQSVTTTNHATQTIFASQPVFDISNNILNFGYSGASGGYVANYNTNAFLNLPDSTLPYNDSSFTYSTRIWNYSTTQFAVLVGGGIAGTSGAGMHFDLNCTSTNQIGLDCYNNSAVNAGTLSANCTITAEYTTGNPSNGTTMFINGTNTFTGVISGGGVRSQSNTFNAIGASLANPPSGWTNQNYMNSQMYYLYVFSSVLGSTDRAVLEATVVPTKNDIINNYTIPTTVSNNGLPTFYYPFWNNTKNYAANTGVGVSDATVSNIAISSVISYNYLVQGSLCNITIGVTITGKYTTSTQGSYTFLYITASSTVIFANATSASVLLVGGGGAGGTSLYSTHSDGSGGGGGGGVGVGTISFSANVTYTATVGTGGPSAGNGSNGGNTSIVGTGVNEIAYGGGRGAAVQSTFSTSVIALGGGCGGGASIQDGSQLGGTATKGSGTLLTYYGGDGAGAQSYYGSRGEGGGGGGAGATATNPIGGNGYTWSVTGLTYAGGGGGGNSNTAVQPAGGTGGGGTGGGKATGAAPTNGTYYGGGGGGGSFDTLGGNGANGIIIIRYTTPSADYTNYSMKLTNISIPSAGLTVAFWFQCTTVINQWFFDLYNSNTSRIALYYNNGVFTDYPFNTSFTYTITANLWYHLVYTVVPSGSNSIVNLYINGGMTPGVANYTNTAAIAYPNFTTTYNYIGYALNNNVYAQRLYGYMNNYYLFPRGLSSVEAVALFSQSVDSYNNDPINTCIMNTISGTAYSSCQGAYACILLNSNYYGPIMQLRSSADSTGSFATNFYSDMLGNLTTGPNGSGNTAAQWSSNVNYAYVTKWYDQSNVTTNDAIQTTVGTQPVYDVANKVINFGYSGSGGGYVANYNSNAYFNLPNSAFPYGDSSYTYVTKLGNHNSGSFAIISGGTDSTNYNINQLSYESTYYQSGWWNTDLRATVSAVPNDVISINYVSGSGTKYLYLNNTSYSLNDGKTRAQTNINNYIGYRSAGNSYMNSQMYYMYVFSTVLSTIDRNNLESTVATASGGSSATLTATGTYTQVSNGIYTLYIFTNSGTLQVTSGSTCYILAVGGGGSGGVDQSGGGGAGGFVESTVVMSGTDTLTVSIGAGGVSANTPGCGIGGQGGNTTVNFTSSSSNNITAYGGGYGASYTNLSSNGGSGGGASPQYTTVGTGISGQGNNGGPANYGGGGGAGAAATDTNGGAGKQTTLVGIAGSTYASYYWAGGGGGGCGAYGNGGIGGGGGGTGNGGNGTGGGSALNTGGNGGTNPGGGAWGANAGANTGGGGGGSRQGCQTPGGNGGSGIVIIAVKSGGGTSNPLIKGVTYNASGFTAATVATTSTTLSGAGGSGIVIVAFKPTTAITSTYASISVSSSNFYISAYTTTTLTLTWATNATFSYISVAPVTGVTSGTSGGTIGTYVTQGTLATTYVATGLISNNYYYFSIVPYNVVNTGSLPVSSYNGSYTLGIVTSTTIGTITTTSIVYNASGTYTSFNWLNNVNSATGSVTGSINGGSFTNTLLVANTAYTYNITPVNGGGTLGAVVTTSSSRTLASISVSSSNFYISAYTTTTLTLTWATNATFSYVSVAPVTGVTSGTSGGTIGSYVAQTTTATTYTLTGLTSNTYYYLSIIPYNTAGTAASAVSSYNGLYTYATYSSASFTATVSSLTVTVTGVYSSFTWKNNTTNTTATVTAVNSGSFTDSSLSLNTGYTYNITPINAASVSGTLTTTSSFSTLAASISVSASNFYISSSTATSVTLTWATNSTFSYVSIAPVTGVTSGTSGGTIGTYVNQTTTATSYTLTGLTSNTYYYLSIVPYNTGGTAAPASSSYNGIYTLGVVTSATGVGSATSVVGTVAGLFTSFIWKNNVNATSATVTATNNGSFTDTSVTAGTPYTYNITPYNSASVAGAIFTTSSISTSNDVTGTATYNGVTYKITSFTTASINNSFNYYNTDNNTIYVLAVGGGGGGGTVGGGGGGGVVMQSFSLPLGNNVININVGAGGTGGDGGRTKSQTNGQNTTVNFNGQPSSNIIAYGGGSGGGGSATTGSTVSTPSTGGSGGGGSATSGTGGGGMTCPGNYTPSGVTTNGASGNTAYNNYANAGGNGICSWAGNWPVIGGGGGGAGDSGQTATTIQRTTCAGVTYTVNSDNRSGRGGNGIQANSTIQHIANFNPSGTLYGTYYWGSGGNGGGAAAPPLVDVLGGSGATGGLNSIWGINAGANTGGGGAGVPGSYGDVGGNGGSGIVIIAYVETPLSGPVTTLTTGNYSTTWGTTTTDTSAQYIWYDPYGTNGTSNYYAHYYKSFVATSVYTGNFYGAFDNTGTLYFNGTSVGNFGGNWGGTGGNLKFTTVVGTNLIDIYGANQGGPGMLICTFFDNNNNVVARSDSSWTFSFSMATASKSANSTATITTKSSFTMFVYTTNGTFTPSVSGNIGVLIVGGGGGGGFNAAGGGGGGGVVYFDPLNNPMSVTAGTAYTVTIGKGGYGGYNGGNGQYGTNGDNSSFNGYNAIGGGGGGGPGGLSGGNGGGCNATSGQGSSNQTPYSAATYSSGYGGGVGSGGSHQDAGGGGGAGGTGLNAPSGGNTSGAGGSGYLCSMTGNYYGGGGGAGYYPQQSALALGGVGGGGIGGGSAAGSSGTPNTGGGGGGGPNTNVIGGNGTGSYTGGGGGYPGGSGIVIIVCQSAP